MRFTLALFILFAAPASAQSIDDADISAVCGAEQFDASRFEAIVRRGAMAVPALLHEVGDASDESKLAERRRSRALRALRCIGPSIANQAVPELVERIAIDMSRDDAELLRTLAVLAPGVDDADAVMDRLDAKAITRPRVDVVPVVAIAQRTSRLDGIRLRLTANTKLDVSALITLLDHEDPLAREYAAERLGQLGSAARDAIPVLVAPATRDQPPVQTQGGTLMRNSSAVVMATRSVAIARIDSRHSSAVRGLTILLRADDPRERVAAAMAIESTDDRTVFDVIPALFAACDDDDPLVVAEAITALGRVGVAHEDVLRVLHGFAGQSGALGARAKAALRRLERRD